MSVTCMCGTPIKSEAAAQRHAKVCDKQGRPGCRITVFHCGYTRGPKDGTSYPPCGEPCVRDGLCAKHLVDRERLQ